MTSELRRGIRYGYGSVRSAYGSQPYHHAMVHAVHKTCDAISVREILSEQYQPTDGAHRMVKAVRLHRACGISKCSEAHGLE